MTIMFHIRPIQTSDNPHIARIIRQVSQEFGLAPESGFAVADPILDDLCSVYQHPHSQYWVIENTQGEILGGGGIAPLQGNPEEGDTGILEIQKMYFLQDIRGLGFAQQILNKCFEFARDHQFKSLYLETTKELYQAVKLYEKMGFVHLKHPKGNTGHSHACEIRMEKRL